MAKIAFQLVMPEREVLAIEADMVVVPGSEGDFGVLHGHAPLISTVRPGVLEVIQDNKVERWNEAVSCISGDQVDLLIFQGTGKQSEVHDSR